MFGLCFIALVLGYTIGFCTNWFYRWLLSSWGHPTVDPWEPRVIREDGVERFVPAMRWADDDALTGNGEEEREDEERKSPVISLDRDKEKHPPVRYKDGLVWVEGEEFVPSITWMGDVPPGTTFSGNEEREDEA